MTHMEIPQSLLSTFLSGPSQLLQVVHMNIVALRLQGGGLIQRGEIQNVL